MSFGTHPDSNQSAIKQSLSSLGLCDESTSHQDSVFERNMQALSIKSPFAAQKIRSATARNDIEWFDTEEQVLSAKCGGLSLASRRRPRSEAQRFVSSFNRRDHALACILGFGLGYHCGEMLEHLGYCGVVMCYEPDCELLRAVFEKIDYTKLFLSNRFFLFVDAQDSTAITHVFTGIEAIIGLGVHIVAHPPSTTRLREGADEFSKMFSASVAATRTHVVTTLANAQVSLRNGLMNLGYYSTTSGIEPLRNSCIGRPAIVVSAGPSLQKNIDLLKDPDVQSRFVIIAVQTVLKTLLSKGIKPHFVAALDYHEVSTRFYEGLSSKDVEGIRLVVEPKANAAILDAFPGEILCVQDPMLDTILGDEHAKTMGSVEAGGTVAHLCYEIARFLGCDPVILIGQDLGFSDGQYYGSGAVIHQSWSGELNEHRTLEMMEWERIARMKPLLCEKVDVRGNQIYSDEQMSTYQSQFELMFQKDKDRSLRVIDASEGGVRKEHTEVKSLKDALSQFMPHDEVVLPDTHGTHTDRYGVNKAVDEDLDRVSSRLDSLIHDCEKIVYQSGRSIELLGKMKRTLDDQRALNSIIEEVQRIGQEVLGMKDAFKICEAINQTGVLNRLKRDRLIDIDAGDDQLKKQKLQINRDQTNVQWTQDAARTVISLLKYTKTVLIDNQVKQIGGIDEIQQSHNAQSDEESLSVTHKKRDRVHAVIFADPQYGGLGVVRTLEESIFESMNALQLTLRRLDLSRELDGITVVTPERDAIQGLIGSMETRLPVHIEQVDPNRFRQRARKVGSARMGSSECWRGSIGMLSVYDEQVDFVQLDDVVRKVGIDGAAIVGADWALLDIELVDSIISTFRNQATEQRLSFSQAVPGIGTMIVDSVSIQSLADTIRKSATETSQGWNHFATFGSLVSYIPVAPLFDPIAKGVCVQIDTPVRDAGMRVMGDTPARQRSLARALRALQQDGIAHTSSGVQSVYAYRKAYKPVCPKTIVLETCTGRLTSGVWGSWKRNSSELIEREVLSVQQAHSFFRDLSSLRVDTHLIFDGVGDPLMHPRAMDFVQLAKEDGLASIELRTDLLCELTQPQQLVDSGLDVLSVDLLAGESETYAELMGQDRLNEVYEKVQAFFDLSRDDRASMFWFVPRMTRCDAVLNQVESFYTKWIMLCGSAVIDPLPTQNHSQRIQALAIPQRRQRQLDANKMIVRSDGSIANSLGKTIHGVNAFRDGVENAYQAMRASYRSSQIELKANKSEYAA